MIEQQAAAEEQQPGASLHEAAAAESFSLPV
jgi:hypothetical protein